MSDIFISYSRKDSEQALQLAELLTSAGLSCWIDTRGIEAATSWSGEIVDAIDHCSAFLVLLSASSIISRNVVKEVSLASERGKKMLPLDLEPVVLPRDLAYQLAGLQRTSMTNIDSIIRALGKLGLQSTNAPVAPTFAKEHGIKKSLMILPFEDLSPTGDNGWFTDGMASELTSALSNVKALRVIDWNTSREFKDRHIRTTVLAKELEVRYFIEGQVRKFGDQIKITVTLLDIETGDHLWQDSLKGTMDDVFDIQETVAAKVVEGLKVHLGSSEREKLVDRGTDNLEAFELYLRANEYWTKGTQEGFRHGLQLSTQALALDPDFPDALYLKTVSLLDLYQFYERRKELLSEALTLIMHALQIKPDYWSAYGVLSVAYRMMGRLDEAEQAAKQFVRSDPERSSAYYYLGLFYHHTGRSVEAIEEYEKAIALQSDNFQALNNVIVQCQASGNTARYLYWVEYSVPSFEKRLRLVPDDERKRAFYAVLLLNLGHLDQAKEALKPLVGKQDLDASTLYSMTCLYALIGDSPEAIASLQRAVEAGFLGSDVLLNDPDLNSLHDIPGFRAIVRGLQGKETK
jgi:adenylate cyclase